MATHDITPRTSAIVTLTLDERELKALFTTLNEDPRHWDSPSMNDVFDAVSRAHGELDA